MANQNSFYWHDFETFGTDPKRDWPSQFAGLRTDEALNIIGDPLMIYCKPPSDCLPHPEACLITGISPQKALADGLCEKDFIKRIHQEMSQPDTCVAGYNSIRFDDEVTRNSLYRCFYDPYQREYMNRNSRWDLIDLVRMTYALRPEGIRWPSNENNEPSFRLELLTKANGIGHEAAHDALSDVIATIEMAKLIKTKQNRLFQYIFEMRKKDKVFELLNLSKQESVIHISGKYPAKQHCLALVVPLYQDLTNKNGIVVCDLDKDPTMLLDLSIEEIGHRLFSKTADLPEGTVRPPIKTIHANKCPALAPTSVLRAEDIERLNLDMTQLEQRRALILQHQTEISQKIKTVLNSHTFDEIHDPDLMLYSGGFFSRNDKQKMQRLISMTAPQLLNAQESLNFEDQRISEMLFRYRARNFPESLSPEELSTWKDYCAKKFKGELPNSSLSIQEFDSAIEKAKQQYTGIENTALENNTDPTESKIYADKLALIEELIAYRDSLLCA